jgi:hypothetical protein
MPSRISDTVTVRLPNALIADLRGLADAEGVGLSVLIRHMIAEGVADRAGGGAHDAEAQTVSGQTAQRDG